MYGNKHEYNYEINENIITIYFKRRSGEIVIGYIDLDDLDKFLEHHYKWGTTWRPSSKSYYSQCIIYKGTINGKASYTGKYLHIFILGIEDSTRVDHINHNTMDNRKENLRPIRHKDNMKNRNGKNSNNSSGYRNVSKIGKWWCVQLQIDGKNTMLHKFPLNKVHEAGYYAELMREKYYGEFAGVS